MPQSSHEPTDRPGAVSRYLVTARRRSVEAELVALDIEHRDAGLVVAIGDLLLEDRRTERDQPFGLGPEGGQPLVSDQPGAGPYVEVHPVLDDLALRHPLEVQPRALPRRIDTGVRRTLLLDRQRAVELVPAGETLRRRRDDVPQHLAPEAGDPLRIRTVEGDLELLDRCHAHHPKG